MISNQMLKFIPNYFIVDFFMVRTYKRMEAYLKWLEDDLRQAIISTTLNGHLSFHGAAEIFKVPFTTLQRRAQEEEFVHY